MGTRATIELKHLNETKRLYVHYDGYPTHLGVKVAEFVRDIDKDKVIHQLETAVEVDLSKTVPLALFRYCQGQGYTDEGVSTGVDWYAALREIQDDLPKILDSGFFPHYPGTAKEDYTYIIDLDEEKFTVLEYSEKIYEEFFGKFEGMTEEALNEWAEKLEAGED